MGAKPAATACQPGWRTCVLELQITRRGLKLFLKRTQIIYRGVRRQGEAEQKQGGGGKLELEEKQEGDKWVQGSSRQYTPKEWKKWD